MKSEGRSPGRQRNISQAVTKSVSAMVEDLGERLAANFQPNRLYLVRAAVHESV